MSGHITLKYTNASGQEVADHNKFHTVKSARLRAKDLKAAKPGATDFRADLGNEKEVVFDFPDLD